MSIKSFICSYILWCFLGLVGVSEQVNPYILTQLPVGRFTVAICIHQADCPLHLGALFDLSIWEHGREYNVNVLTVNIHVCVFLPLSTVR